mmetsp:Transcript_27639/g.69508  ORF Transcript_27639/g.69508 Transcript_27639/m.69508 type:complete len:227 (+) Transcript_27639:455-1135(+)
MIHGPGFSTISPRELKLSTPFLKPRRKNFHGHLDRQIQPLGSHTRRRKRDLLERQMDHVLLAPTRDVALRHALEQIDIRLHVLEIFRVLAVPSVQARFEALGVGLGDDLLNADVHRRGHVDKEGGDVAKRHELDQGGTRAHEDDVGERGAVDRDDHIGLLHDFDLPFKSGALKVLGGEVELVLGVLSAEVAYGLLKVLDVDNVSARLDVSPGGFCLVFPVGCKKKE